MDIRAEDLTFRYDDNRETAPVLEQVSFELKSGECAALVGPSGSGKSTLAQLLNGLLSPASGHLLFDGHLRDDRFPNRRDLRRRVALVFQLPEAQIFETTVFEEVSFAARQWGTPKDEIPRLVESALEAVGLDPEIFQNRNPLNLSGGESRLVTIASLLVIQPDWLILDEPTLGLDYPHKVKIKAVIQNRRPESGILLITHDLDLAMAICPRMLALDQGRLVWDGSSSDLLTRRAIFSEFDLAEAESVRIWQRLKTAAPEVTLPEPLELETWAAGLKGEARTKVNNALKEIQKTLIKL
jgi:energy-coupling factor transport system ATP-binding protein